ncbi:MAG: hypothetical protein QG610_574, partial [Euryarchaeota archaeon]|nr:hypothetical protein [Euryarchaeota archaeon]
EISDLNGISDLPIENVNQYF